MIPVLLAILAAAPWYEQKLEGWYYFQEKPAEERQGLSPEEAEEIMREERERLKELLSLAILVPTKENVAQYIEAEKRWSDQSTLFAKEWTRLEEDPFLPMSKKMFLLFCYRGEDPTSVLAAETARAFAKGHGWKLRAVALDGKEIDGVPAEMDRGIGKRLPLVAAPSFYIVDPSESRITAVGQGAVSLEELETNILNHD